MSAHLEAGEACKSIIYWWCFYVDVFVTLLTLELAFGDLKQFIVDDDVVITVCFEFFIPALTYFCSIAS